MKKKWRAISEWLVIGAGSAVGALSVSTLVRYRREKRGLLAGLWAGSQVVETACGPVEYAVEGEGPVVLISHGALGGYDQGIAIARLFRTSGFKFIAVSRAGYLRTPLVSGRTPEAQADAYAALLDALGVPGAAVLSLSAGGPSALQFALRHPDRCWGLVLLSAINQPLPPLPPPANTLSRLQGTLLRFDFVWWLLYKVAFEALASIAGLPGTSLERVKRDPVKMEVLRGGVLAPVISSSLRRVGVINDTEQVAALPVYSVEHIVTPTLVVHSPTDPLVPFAQAEWVAGRLPGAQLVVVDGGGHLCAVSHREQVVPEVVAFLDRHAPGGEN